MGLALTVATLAGAAVVAAPLVGTAAAAPAGPGLPRHCPRIGVVTKLLGLPISKLTSRTRKVSPGRRAERSCIYANGTPVPTTIAFVSAVSRSTFDAARRNASKSVRPFTVHGLGDEAWEVDAPARYPAAGKSLFVLDGTLDIVVGAPRATDAELVRLVRTLL